MIKIQGLISFNKGAYMSKTIPFLCFLFLMTATSFAEDTVKVVVATQLFHCDLGEKLDCAAVNQIQEKEFLLKKNGGAIHMEDKEHGLTGDIVTAQEGNNVNYSFTLCSNLSCTMSTTGSDSVGNISQSMSGQYHLKENSFYVLLFYITNQVNSLKLEYNFNKIKSSLPYKL